jgi:hypothetical protein
MEATSVQCSFCNIESDQERLPPKWGECEVCEAVMCDICRKLGMTRCPDCLEDDDWPI